MYEEKLNDGESGHERHRCNTRKPDIKALLQKLRLESSSEVSVSIPPRLKVSVYRFKRPLNSAAESQSPSLEAKLITPPLTRPQRLKPPPAIGCSSRSYPDTIRSSSARCVCLRDAAVLVRRRGGIYL